MKQLYLKVYREAGQGLFPSLFFRVLLTGTGWFSDRSTRYLAAGKPVLVQETGFSAYLPAGLGIVSFSTLDEALSGAQSIAQRYDEHCEAARELAEQRFAAEVVLPDLLERAGVAA